MQAPASVGCSAEPSKPPASASFLTPRATDPHCWLTWSLQGPWGSEPVVCPVQCQSAPSQPEVSAPSGPFAPEVSASSGPDLPKVSVPSGPILPEPVVCALPSDSAPLEPEVWASPSCFGLTSPEGTVSNVGLFWTPVVLFFLFLYILSPPSKPPSTIL